MTKFAVLFVAMAFAATAYGAPFSDVPRTHWAYDAIQKAVAAGVLQGYDGKFDGQRLLNRYQMAVVTAKLLDKVQAGGGTVTGSSEDVKKMIANLEALTIEFADELALLNVKVSTLEDTVKELQAGKGTARVAKPVSGDIGFTAFASFALVMEDDEVGPGGPYVRYNGNDTTYFTLPQVSMGVDKEVNPGVYFHMQLDYASDVNEGAGWVVVNEAYFFMDEMFGDIGGKAGAFAYPFSMEHNGPFRSCNLTITPSIANTYHEQQRFYGLELQKTKDVQPDDLLWKFGIVSGSDSAGMPGFNMMDGPVAINQGEGDDGFGFYIWLGKKPERTGKLGWNLGFFSNGGDNAPDPGFTASAETDFFQLGIEWANDDMLIMLQYLDGEADGGAAGVNYDFNMWYFLFNYKVDEKQSVTLRYDAFEQGDGGAGAEGNAITFAYNRKVTDNSMFQFEFLTHEWDEATTDDQQIQFRYKVHF